MLAALLAFWGAKPGVVQLECAVSDPEMGRAVLGVEPYKGPDRHKSQAQAALG